MVSVSDEEVADLSGRLELISGRTNKNAEEIRGLLKELSTRNAELVQKIAEESSACMRIRKIQVDALMRKFTASLGAFEATENSIQAKSRDLLVRRLQIVQPTVPTDDVIKVLTADAEKANAEMMKTNVFAVAATSADLDKHLEHLRAQQRSMQRLEKNILVLNQMFLDMQNLVIAQDEQLNHVENYVKSTVEYQKVTDVDRAIEYQKNIRKVTMSISIAYCLLLITYCYCY